jgi:D-alanyl-D-alanine carboxypeptidase/D-alanyl-D-alanine-endopeptidase (penicillin-binding protein 4)
LPKEMRKYFGFAVFLMALLPAVVTASVLPAQVQNALNAVRIPLNDVSVVVQPLAGGAPLIALNGDTARNPASVIKLVTTLAALDTLGPAYQWRTELLSEAVPRDGVLAGDLVLRGNGDPKFTYERLWLLLRQLRDRGVREIRGDLLLDRSAFAPAPASPAEFDNRPLRPYNALPDALLVNFNALTLRLRPEEGGDGINVTVQPAPDNLVIENRLRKTANVACGEWREQLRAQPLAAAQRTRLVLTGNYPESCGEKDWHVQAMAPNELIGGVFRALWRELGGSFSGLVREASTPLSAQPLAVLSAPTLYEAVRDINKYSNNVMARQLYLTLGREVQLRKNQAMVTATSDADADSAVRQWLADKSLSLPQLVMGNGAGLARETRISANELAKLLRYAWQSPVMPEFIASLPVVASDGTMRKRLGDTPAAGRAHIKTGSLEGVKALAGYVLDVRGQRWLVVFMVNHAQANAAQPAMDALLLWLAQGTMQAAAPTRSRVALDQ